MTATNASKSLARLSVYTTDRHIATDGTAARINARLSADGLTRHVATLCRNGKLTAETFWAYAGTADEMAASMAANRKAELVSVSAA